MADRELLTLSLYQLLASNRGGLFVVYFPLFLVAERGAPVAVALAIVSLAYVAASLVGPVAGRWSDRVGRRRPFLLAAEAGALPCFVAIAFAPGYLAAGAAFVAAQAVLAVGSPALNAYVADLTRQRERGRGFGLLNATSSLGQILGFAVVAALLGPFGLGALFPFVVAVMVGTVAIVLVLVPDRRVPVDRRRLSAAEARPLLAFSVAVSVRAMGIGAVGAFLGVYAAQLGASAAEVAAIAVAGLAAAAVVSVPFGRLIDRIGPMRGVAYGTLLSLAGIALFLAAPSWPFLAPAQATRLVGVALLSPAMLTWVANLAPAGHRAEYQGLFALVNSTLWSLGPLAGGLALAAGGAAGLFAFAIGATLVSLVAIERLARRPGYRDGDAAPPPGAAPSVGSDI